MTVPVFANTFSMCKTHPLAHTILSGTFWEEVDGVNVCSVCGGSLENKKLVCSVDASHSGISMGEALTCAVCAGSINLYHIRGEVKLVSEQGRVAIISSDATGIVSELDQTGMLLVEESIETMFEDEELLPT